MKLIAVLLAMALIVLAIVQVTESSNCYICPYCGSAGWKIGEQRVGNTIIYVYKCGNLHIWQCSW